MPHKCAGRRGVIDGRAQQKTVGLLEEWRHLVYRIVENAFSQFATAATADASANGQMSHVYGFGFDALTLQRLLHFL